MTHLRHAKRDWTYDVLGTNKINELGVLGVVNVCAKRYVADGEPPGNCIASQPDDFFRFVQNILQ